MASDYIKNITPEQRAVILAASHVQRQKNIAYWNTLHLRQNWQDKELMMESLHKKGLRKPAENEPATISRIKQLLRRVDIDGKQIKEAIGPHWEEKTVDNILDRWLKMNDHPVHGAMPLWAAVALIIELKGE